MKAHKELSHEEEADNDVYIKLAITPRISWLLGG